MAFVLKGVREDSILVSHSLEMIPPSDETLPALAAGFVFAQNTLHNYE